MGAGSGAPVIMITGGARFIGTHTAVEVLAPGFGVVVVDDLRNSAPAGLERVAELGCRAPAFARLDVRVTEALVDVVRRRRPVGRRRSPEWRCRAR